MDNVKILFFYSGIDSPHLVKWGKRVISDVRKSSGQDDVSDQVEFLDVIKSNRLMLVPMGIYFFVLPISLVFVIFKRFGLRFLDLRFALECAIWRQFFKSKKDVRTVMAIEGSRALYKICREMGIETFELQHGVFPNSRPAVGRPMSYFQNDGEPDNYVVWSENSEFVVKQHSYKNTLKYPRAFGLRVNEDKDIDIVVTLQWGLFDKNQYDAETLHPIGLPQWSLDELSHFQKLGANILFKIHMVDLANDSGTEIYNEIGKYFGQDVVRKSRQYEREDVINLLVRAKCHVTLYSSCVIEAAEVGVQSIIIDDECASRGVRHDYFADYLHNGDAYIVNRGTIGERITKIIMLGENRTNIC